MNNIKNEISVTFDKFDNLALKELGNRLKFLRQNRGVSQQVLSEMIYRDRSGISFYELGKKTPTLHGLHDIASALDYKLKINFVENKKGTNDKMDKTVFSENYLKNFINNLNSEEEYEYNFSRLLETHNETWDILEIEKDTATLKSESGKMLKLITNTDDIKFDRCVPITVKCFKNSEEHSYTDHIYRDLSDEFSLLDLLTIKKLIIECASLEIILYCYPLLDEFKDNFNSDNISSTLYLNYSTLKTVCGLKDSDILHFLEIVLPDFLKTTTFIDTVNSSNEIHDLELKTINSALVLVEDYIENNYINSEIAVDLRKIALLFKLDDAVNCYVYDGYNEDTQRITCYESGDNAIIDEILALQDVIFEECFKNLYFMKDRNESKDEFTVISDIISAFYPDVIPYYLNDRLNDLMDSSPYSPYNKNIN